MRVTPAVKSKKWISNQSIKLILVMKLHIFFAVTVDFTVIIDDARALRTKLVTSIIVLTGASVITSKGAVADDNTVIVEPTIGV